MRQRRLLGVYELALSFPRLRALSCYAADVWARHITMQQVYHQLHQKVAGSLCEFNLF